MPTGRYGNNNNNNYSPYGPTGYGAGGYGPYGSLTQSHASESETNNNEAPVGVCAPSQPPQMSASASAAKSNWIARVKRKVSRRDKDEAPTAASSSSSSSRSRSSALRQQGQQLSADEESAFDDPIAMLIAGKVPKAWKKELQSFDVKLKHVTDEESARRAYHYIAFTFGPQVRTSHYFQMSNDESYNNVEIRVVEDRILKEEYWIVEKHLCGTFGNWEDYFHLGSPDVPIVFERRERSVVLSRKFDDNDSIDRTIWFMSRDDAFQFGEFLAAKQIGVPSKRDLCDPDPPPLYSAYGSTSGLQHYASTANINNNNAW